MLRLSAISFIFFILSALKLDAQNWAESSSEWFYCDAIGNPTSSFTRYFVEKDTIVNNISCKKITNNSVVHLMYESSGKVYYWFKDEFHLIYDYTAEKGDTTTFAFTSYSPSSLVRDTTYAIDCVLESIDTALINGSQVYTWDFDIIIDTSLNHVTWSSKYIYSSQIGYLPQFMLSLDLPSIGFNKKLRCFSNNSIAYENPWWTPFGLPCDNGISTAISDVQNGLNIEIVNPVSHSLIIKERESEAKRTNISFQVFDVIGGSPILLEKNIELPYSKDISELNAGIYLLVVKKGTEISQFKLLKK